MGAMTPGDPEALQAEIDRLGRENARLRHLEAEARKSRHDALDLYHKACAERSKDSDNAARAINAFSYQLVRLMVRAQAMIEVSGEERSASRFKKRMQRLSEAVGAAREFLYPAPKKKE